MFEHSSVPGLTHIATDKLSTLQRISTIKLALDGNWRYVRYFFFTSLPSMSRPSSCDESYIHRFAWSLDILKLYYKMNILSALIFAAESIFVTFETIGDVVVKFDVQALGSVIFAVRRYFFCFGFISFPKHRTTPEKLSTILSLLYNFKALDSERLTLEVKVNVPRKSQISGARI